MPVRHFASHPEVTMAICIPDPGPIGWRMSRRVKASVFCPVHHGSESSHFHKTSCSDISDSLPCSCFPDSAIASSNKSILPESFGCREKESDVMTFHKLTDLSFEFTSHVRDQVTAQFIQTISSTDKTSSGLFRWHWKANVESRGKIYNTQELKHLFVRVREYKEIHSYTLIEFGVCVFLLRKKVTFRRFVLHTNVALEFIRRSNRDLVRSTNSQNTTKQFLAGVSQVLVDTHFCQLYRISLGTLTSSTCGYSTDHRICLHWSDPFPHLRQDKFHAF